MKFVLFTVNWTAIEAIGSFGGLILALVVACQSRKIKTLTDVVIELKKQGDIQNKRLDLETMIAIAERMPYFTFPMIYRSNPKELMVSMVNIGKAVTGISVVKTYNFQRTKPLRIETPEVLTNRSFIMHVYGLEPLEEFRLGFEMVAIDKDGGRVFHEIIIEKDSITITPPSPSISKEPIFR